MDIIAKEINECIYRFRCSVCKNIFEMTKEDFDVFNGKSKDEFNKEVKFIEYDISGKRQTKFHSPICNRCTLSD